MMDAALTRSQFEYQSVRNHLDSSGYSGMPIIVGETGWKADPSGGELQRAHPVNQKMYFDRLEAWKASVNGPKTVVHFAAFDEPWKRADDKWGLFNVQRQARCVIQALNANLRATSDNCAPASAVYYQAAATTGPVTAQRLTVYAENTVVNEARPSTSPILNAWENGTTAVALEVDDNSGDGSKVIRVTPQPAVWGWGMTWAVSGVETDMSNFQASTARLNFRIKTTYAGKIEIGFLTGNTIDRSARDVYLPISPGQFGYNNDGVWHQVSIPISALVANGAPAYGMPSSAILQMNRVSNLFVIADRYETTRNPSGSKPNVLLDDIHWTR
jgi:hypothetical protein